MPDPDGTDADPTSPLFTVFTPTHQRAHTLSRVYHSLLVQTFTDFEWLVVDDGSTDGTDELVARWSAEAPFPIRYQWQPNGGKHVAFNRGVREARGALFLTLDSDDECVPTALERFAGHWRSIPPADRPRFSAVTALCADADGEVVGSQFPFDPTDSDPIEIEYRYGVHGEKWGFHRTDVLAQYPFPEMPGQVFVTESLVWHRIAHHYRTRYVNDVLRTYRRDSDGDSLTAGNTPNIVGRSPMFALRDHMILTEEIGWFRHAPGDFVRAAANYARFSRHAGQGFVEQSRSLGRPAARLLHALVAPIGLVLWARDVRNGRAAAPLRGSASASSAGLGSGPEPGSAGAGASGAGPAGAGPAGAGPSGTGPSGAGPSGAGPSGAESRPGCRIVGTAGRPPTGSRGVG